MLIAFTEADEANSFSVSGGSLSWNLIDQLTTASGSAVNSLSTWWAYTASALSGITISCTKSGSFTANGLKVCVFTGTESSFSGAHGTASSNTITKAMTQTGSWGWAAIGDNLGATTDAAGTGCVYNDAETAFGGVSGGILKRSAMDGVNGGNLTMSAGTASSNMSIAFVEIKAPSTSIPVRSTFVRQALMRAATH